MTLTDSASIIPANADQEIPVIDPMLDHRSKYSA